MSLWICSGKFPLIPAMYLHQNFRFFLFFFLLSFFFFFFSSPFTLADCKIAGWRNDEKDNEKDNLKDSRAEGQVFYNL